MKQSYNLSDLDTRGFLEINDFLDSETINNFKKCLDNLYDINGNRNFVLTDDKLNKYIFGDYYKNNKFKEVISKVFLHEKIKFSYEDNYKVLRVLNGKESNADNQNYHFDGYYLTAMLPLEIPTGNEGKNGDFILVPNIRKIFKNKNINLIIKYIFQNKLIKLLYKNKIFLGFFKPKRIIPKAGSLIIFRGFASLHGSEILGPNKKRVTLLYHFHKMK